MGNHKSTARDAAVILGGVAAGIVGSRVLPPLIGQAWGSLNARFGGDPFERLIQDHRQIRSVLHVMEQTPETETVERAKLFLRLKRTLAKHSMAEEDVVYPLLKDTAGEEEHVKHLYGEHAEIKMHLYELEQLLNANADWTERVRTLRGMIEEHIRDEEQNQFPKLRQSMNKVRNRETASLIRREEALVL